MAPRLHSAFVFGHLGNLDGALGDGWSVEDHYAWAVGNESRLMLPLPGDDADYVLRFTLYPLVEAGTPPQQRLEVATREGMLAGFALSEPATVEIPLPPHLTSGRDRIELILTHPDAVRPQDYKESPDQRWLTLCFQSGGLERRELAAKARAADQGAALRHAVIVGDQLAAEIAEVLARLPSLQGRLAVHRLPPEAGRELRAEPGPEAMAAVPTRGGLKAGGSRKTGARRETSGGATARDVPAKRVNGHDAPPAAAAYLPAGVMETAAILWEQTDADAPAAGSALRQLVPANCEVRLFPAPRLTALWPLNGSDPRLVHEPGRYDAGRYPFPDRVGASLASMWLTDDVMVLAYEAMAEKEMPDLDARLDADLAGWRRLDAVTNLRVADFIGRNFRTERLFLAPSLVSPVLLRHILNQLLATPALAALCDPARLRTELDFLLAGYVGRRRELPIHPFVARHFELAWWQPGMRYRWFGNRWTFEQYALNYIRWAPWCP
jgi:hypothetical protein